MTSRYRRDALSVAHLTGWELCPTSEGQLSNCFAPRPPCGHGLEGTGRTIFLWDVDTSGRTPSIAFMPEIFDDLCDFVLCHTICGFLCRPFGHGSSVAIDATVSRKEQIRVVQESVDAL